MSTVRDHFIKQAMDKTRLDEFLMNRLRDAGYGGAEISRTPLGTRITIFALRPGLVIGRGGTIIKALSKELQEKFNVPNPQIAVADISVPELNPYIMASRIALAMQRGIHFRRAAFWALERIMRAGALGAEVKISGKLTSERARYEKYRVGYLPKSGDPAMKYVKSAVYHLLLKPGIYGIKVTILPPGVEFPDKIELKEAAKEVQVEEGEERSEEGVG
ncbi:MAG: 30S ribosomal protein S3, small subunit ribosomal protein S3 [Candidatus Bathyarchaeota archaeon B24]|nr:MAG: 30S ribosomal protein S3, small subunit ribosomal protein S3 [Candidatus Bathyarchaeota archaeon B24]RLI26295.1 MAG: 30S ribosomal protein S3 [Candidatus Bathyarchaeota archaeon]